MFLIYYVNTVLGIILLALDVRGHLRASGARVVALRILGVGAAGVASFTPLVWWHGTDPTGRGSIFPFVAYAFVVLFAIFAADSLLFPRSRPSRWAQRLAYAGLLALSAIPSFVLLPLNVPVAIAGVALVRGQDVTERATGRT